MVERGTEIETLIRETSHAMALEVAKLLERQQQINAQLLRLVERLVERQEDTRANVEDLSRLLAALSRTVASDAPRPKLH